MYQELYKFRVMNGHEGPLKATDPNWMESKYNLQIDWETVEIIFEHLSMIAAEDPSLVLLMPNRTISIILKAGKDLGISSRKRNNLQEP